MSSLNQCTFIGNLGADAEIRQTKNGDNVATINLACSDSWTDKNTGEKRTKTEWIRIVVWGKLADVVEKYTQKGSKLFIQGEFKTRKWNDKDGVERYTTEIVVQGFKGKLILLGTRDKDGKTSGSTSDNSFVESAKQAESEMDDEIPF